MGLLAIARNKRTFFRGALSRSAYYKKKRQNKLLNMWILDEQIQIARLGMSEYPRKLSIFKQNTSSLARSEDSALPPTAQRTQVNRMGHHLGNFFSFGVPVLSVALVSLIIHAMNTKSSTLHMSVTQAPKYPTAQPHTNLGSSVGIYSSKPRSQASWAVDLGYNFCFW